MRRSERRTKHVRRRLLAKLEDPVLIQFAREKKHPKQIALAYVGAAYAQLKRQGREDQAEKLLRNKVRWVERRIMGAL